MIKTLIKSIKLNNTYNANKIIYFLKNSIIGEKISNDMYSNKKIKIIGYIFNVIKTILSLLIGKILIVLIIFILMKFFEKEGIFIANGNTFFQILIFLIVCEAFAQASMFENGEVRFYSVILLKMDAKKYVLSNYYWKMFLRFISFAPVLAIFGKILGMPTFLGILVSSFSILLKMIFNYLRIKDFTKNRAIMQKLLWPVCIACSIMAVGFPIVHLILPISWFYILYTIVLLIGIYSIYKIQKYDKYYELYKKILMPESSQTQSKVGAFNLDKHTEFNINKTANNKKIGFSYLNSLFIVRHKKELYLSTIIKCLSFLLEYAIIVISILSEPISYTLISQNFLIAFCMLLYITFSVLDSTSMKFVQILFKDCDYAMLTFTSYRSKQYIMKNFKQRFIILIKLHFLPVIIAIIGLLITAKVAGVLTDWANAIIISASIIAIALYSSMHRLIIYYMLQPYTYSEITKNILDNRPIINILACFKYIILFFVVPLAFKLSLFEDGLIICLYTIIYILVSLAIVNKFACKTFKIKK